MVKRLIVIAMLVGATIAFSACSGKSAEKTDVFKSVTNGTAKITFLELGSTTCIPCKKMQPVMKSIEARYTGQVKVIFHDVVKDRGKSQEFGIKLIPTQVFLDSTGKELMRHEGFFAEEEIDKFLKAQGLIPQS